ncbi:MAG TPA: DUF4097 family beta strand repeat-containing protein [Steroidobacteraceae bacterium]|nr:DUF4097 family beta strand repeat-containing protein [Steroidobacteraceae bacterium]
MTTSLIRIAILATSLALAGEAAHASDFQQQIAADPRGEVDVSNVAGDIVITGWDRPAVSVTADLSSDTQRVQVKGGHGRTSVCVTYGESNDCNGPGGFHEGGSVRLEVHVPRNSELDVSAVSADIKSHDVAGSQHLHSVSGDINADLGSGDDEVNSVSGTITLHGSAKDGTLHIGNVSGDVTVTNAAGELEARTVNGTLRAELAPARHARLNTTSGDIELTARLEGNGSIETETVSGDQKLDVSAPAGYSYEAKTFSGDIDNCFGQRPDESRYGPGSRLNGTRGGGAGHVRMQSLSGGISLCDR